MAEKKPSKTTYATILVCVFTLAFFGVCTPQFNQIDLSGVVAEVDGNEISYHEFVRSYRRMSDNMRQRYGEDYDPKTLKVASQTIDQLIKERVLYLEALKLGIRASDDEIVKYLTKLSAFSDEKGQFSSEYMSNYLRSNNYTEATFQEELRRSLSISRLRDLLFSSAFASDSRIKDEYKASESKLNVSYVKIATDKIYVDTTEKDLEDFTGDALNQDKMRAWYDSHTSDYQQDEQVKARHILISFQGTRSASTEASKRSKEDARSKAEKVLKLVKSPKSSFVKLVKEYTDEPNGKTSGGDLGYFARDAMVEKFSNAAFALATGAVSDIIETEFGFHIIKNEGRKPAKNIPYEQAKNEIAKLLIQKENGPQVASGYAQSILNLLKDNKETESFLKEKSLSWQETGDFSLTARYITGLGSDESLRSAALSLNNTAKIYPEILQVGGDYFVLKLKSYTPVDTNKLDKDKLEQIGNTLKFSSGYGFYSTFESHYIDEYKKKNLITKSPKYLALDEQADHT